MPVSCLHSLSIRCAEAYLPSVNAAPICIDYAMVMRTTLSFRASHVVVVMPGWTTGCVVEEETSKFSPTDTPELFI